MIKAINHIILILIFAFNFMHFSSKLCFCQKDTYPYLVNAQSLLGYTGNIITPSPHTVEKSKFALGLHGFNVGLNYGIIPYGEVGVSFDLKELTASENFIQKISTAVAIHTKYNILNQYSKKHYFDFSVGVYRQVFYFVFGKRFENLFNTEIESGIETGIAKETVSYFISISKFTKYSNFIFDYNSNAHSSNFGWRVLLSPEIKLDLFLINLQEIRNVFDNFVFGLTLVS